jgi:putative transposase
MNFQAGDLYHVFNQGNNRQKIFFTRNNYLFFLQKIKKLISPHADILAWCLMPNHFHLMIYISDGFTNSDCTGLQSEAVTKPYPKRTLNDSIGILLRSYTRAINKQENMSGSLFRNPTHAECLTTHQGITPSFFNTAFGAQINILIPEKEYPQTCFNYIHQNPVKAKLVKQPEDWEFSSYIDYSGARNGKLVNRERAKEFGLLLPY